jgi:hypothetical protein
MGREWFARVRGGWRGAWQWPAFVALTIADAVLVHELPFAGSGPDWFAALLLAMFFNLLAVGVAGPLLGLLVRRRRHDLPAIVAADRAGTAALVAVAAILVALGVAHRPALRADQVAFATQSAVVRRFVADHAPAQYRARIDEADSLRFGDELYRTCVPGARPDRAYCLFIDLSSSPPVLRVDSDRAPNADYAPVGRR